jgi:hypothetical protein
VGFSSLPTEADAFPGGLPFSVAIDREVVKDDCWSPTPRTVDISWLLTAWLACASHHM